jgi:hypothetical protein
VAGTFVYAPAAGTVLPAGTQMLTATFTPTNSALYTTATASRSLVVTAASPNPVVPVGSAFVGPKNGGAWSGQLQNGRLLYNGVSYPVVGEVVTFPDCANYIVAPNGMLFQGPPPSNTCTPTGGSSPSASTFVGPKNGGAWSGQLQNGQLLYNGASYPVVNAIVTFPDCANYIVAPNGLLFQGPPASNTCTPR